MRIGVAGAAAPAVDGKPDEVEREQLAELAAELEPGLVAPVVGRRACPRPASRTRERRTTSSHTAGTWCCQQPAPRKLRLSSQLSLRASRSRRWRESSTSDVERGRQVELAAEPVRRRDLGEELLDASGADRVEHLLLELGHRVRHVGMCGHGGLLDAARQSRRSVRAKGDSWIVAPPSVYGCDLHDDAVCPARRGRAGSRTARGRARGRRCRRAAAAGRARAASRATR